MKLRNKKDEGLGIQVPPRMESVSIYFIQKGFPESEAERFFRFYDNADWKNAKGTPVQNWKTLACDWIWNKKFGFRQVRN